MGFIRAEWHIAVGTVDHSDPFAALPKSEPEGPPVADPAESLRRLIWEEAALFDRGVTCPLKDRDWCHPNCSDCPERGLAERAELCRVGMEQERVLACS